MTRLRSRRATAIAATLAALVAVLGGVAAIAAGESGGGSGERPLIITAEVARRTLVDDVTVRGTVGRVEQRQVDAGAPGRISAVHVADGTTVEAGQPILSIDGRDAIAAAGTFPFYRDLDVGAEGNDVRQLEEILRAAGYSPGAVDPTYTEETRGALARWQDAHGYPNAAPELDETFTISLSPGNGYTIGEESSAGVVIAQSASKAGPVVVPVEKQEIPVNPAFPLLRIEAIDADVAEGAVARFRISSSVPDHDEWKIELVVGGTADPADIVAPAGKVTLPRNTQTVEVAVPVRQDDLVEPDEVITVALVDQSGFEVGEQATATLVSEDVPELRISGGNNVTEGVTAVMAIVADQAPIHDVQVGLSFGGDATSGDDYLPVDPVVVLRAGRTRVEVPITTLVDETIEDAERLLVTIAGNNPQYRVGRFASAVTTIDRATGIDALPVLTLRPTATHVAEGQPIPMSLSLTRAIADDLIVSLVYAGTAGLGSDYTPVPGRVTIGAGQTSLALQVPTVQDDTVEADRTLSVTLAPSLLYRVGTPATGTVTIESDDVPELRLQDAVVSRLGEGGGGGFTFVADQAPITDISVAYQVLGSATPGQDFDALTGVVILPAGQRSVTVPLSTLRDDVVFKPTDMIVGDWPIRIGQVLVDEGDSLQPGAPLLSLTETDLTVTLRASATDRTKLQPGQTVTVKLSGGTTSAQGTISSLDETASIDEATGEQFYEGKVDVAGLDAADGAAVTIEVVLDERVDALTVPIAAVLQNGDGDDVVRIIDLATGEVTEVPVTTGISEGSYMEIDGGLEGGEVVIVQVDRPES